MLHWKECGALRDPLVRTGYQYNVTMSLIFKWHRKRHAFEKAAKMEHCCRRIGQRRARLMGTIKGPRFPDMEDKL